ncbi:hypothetical protein PV355_01595 [Streptomyces stelliscabiei]|uniref:hypothetical protein n=1 Tax=Streptomyces stelliscabiei TaxID=146820 RepID=UPI0029A19F1D|nr:hypothetical protein [Streptomyces stelliscabiei]MDX2513860.1 hypothetical protein [Streptomyces stelliscabiei]
MSTLPEQYQRYARPAVVHPAEVELYDDRDPVVWIPGAYGEMVPVRKSQAPAAVQAPPVRDLTPRPLFDPLAQRLLGGGLGVGAAGAGLGFGFGQLAAGIALMGTSGLALLVGLLLAAGMRGGSVTHVRQEVHQHARWFGKNHTNL